MRFGIIKDGAWNGGIIDNPQFFNGTAFGVKAEMQDFRNAGLWPIITIDNNKGPEYQRAKVKRTVDVDRQEIVETILYKKREIDDVLAEKHVELNSYRAEKVQAGMRYTFPDTEQPGTVQAGTQDIINVLGLVLHSIILISVMNDTTTTLPFRDLENCQHFLTPNQTIEMGLALCQWITAQYGESWRHKNLVDALSTAAAIATYENHKTDWAA